MIVFILISVIKILLVLLVGSWITIVVSLKYRRRRIEKLNNIEQVFAEICSDYLYPFPGEEPELVDIQRRFRKVGIIPSKPRNVQYLIDLMIRTQRSLLGQNYLKLEILFHQIPPYRVSIGKLKSKKWWIKARGIREIYEMDQKQYINEILKERNNKNIYVRREAQIAMVVFLGWESLRFLPYLKREMTLWQQIKVVEKLHDLYPEPQLKLLKKGFKSDKAYSNELLMRIIRKFKIQEEVDFIIGFLDHPKFDTRETALYCISTFNLNEEKIKQIQNKFFNIPNTEQRIQLLKYINRISKMSDLEFYKNLLYTENDIIKLTTAEILWENGYKEDVQEFYYQQYANQTLNV
ncbi:MAG: hypothetical protein ACQEWG_14200 [Bacteroidota bacterium]